MALAVLGGLVLAVAGAVVMFLVGFYYGCQVTAHKFADAVNNLDSATLMAALRKAESKPLRRN